MYLMTEFIIAELEKRGYHTSPHQGMDKYPYDYVHIKESTAGILVYEGHVFTYSISAINGIDHRYNLEDPTFDPEVFLQTILKRYPAI